MTKAAVILFTYNHSIVRYELVFLISIVSFLFFLVLGLDLNASTICLIIGILYNLSCHLTLATLSNLICSESYFTILNIKYDTNIDIIISDCIIKPKLLL